MIMYSMMHVGRARKHPLHIEYVHIGACLAFIQDTLTEALLSHPRIKMDRKAALVRALGKVIWIQNDLFAKWYVRDGDEFAAEMEEQHEYEKEGYLDGRKILDDIDEAEHGVDRDATPKTPQSPGVSCPFSGIPVRQKSETGSPKQEYSSEPAAEIPSPQSVGDGA